MEFIDYIVFGIYFFGVLAVGIYFYRQNQNREDYFIGSRNIGASHIGMSIVATDVGGGFSIGLGGLGFVMGIAGTWLLFTGLIGAWISAIIIVPKIKKIDKANNMMTFPDFLRYSYNDKVALLAAIISGIGYLGFTGAQILAGAKLAAGSIFSSIDSVNPLDLSLYLMGIIVIIYTALGGIKAVIYTDTIQWNILLIGLMVFGVPASISSIGGVSNLFDSLPSEYFSFTNITIIQFVNWMFTIIPIWFIAMTLYQRIYAAKNVKEAKKAFFIAGLLEYPIMAFLGVILGMIAKIHFPDVNSEMGMPLLLTEVLPIGITGIIVAAFFSAIMSTADSCLIASSGNFLNDVIERYILKNLSHKKVVVLSQITTFVIGTFAIILAQSFETVLEIILHAYSFMVAGLLVPTLIAYFSKHKNSKSAIYSMLGGGIITLVLIFSKIKMPFGFDPSIYGILVSGLVYYLSYKIIRE
ncbi:MAG: sodium:solute symporter family protein [Ignavibacteriae bacterium]|nr:sodium:solute symporter family protein [Ignavibacteriota bacterium]MCB9210399.1 sodium:solute symporter family protein [Ignavibacteriales bacterium]MCB9219204.1 sodium:solute symporter family protein [Ignavibacteriales bacterium]MCB9259786.1 sodium:solute symporter family protein [Ignavibacteriales bacterium]